MDGRYIIYKHYISDLVGIDKIVKILCNAFQPSKGLHQTKIIFLFMELFICRGRRRKYKQNPRLRLYIEKNAEDVTMLKL